ncbi:MAG: fibronectin type III domain-containing protein [Desulfuromusa sp.]|nr:fibronectin type III domain-containing protein [Desulfuromusa sp.]
MVNNFRLKNRSFCSCFLFSLIVVLVWGLSPTTATAKKQNNMLAVSLGEGRVALFWPAAKQLYTGGGWQLQDRTTGKEIARWTAQDLEKGIASLSQEQQKKMRPFLASLATKKNKKKTKNQVGWLMVGAMTDFQLAQKLGMGTILKDIPKGKRSYWMTILNKKNRPTKIKLTCPAVDSWKPSPLPKPVANLLGTGGERGVELRWKNPVKQKIPTPGYIIKRKIENRKEEQLNQNPLWLSAQRDETRPEFIDLLAPFEAELTYSIRLRDIFGRLSVPATTTVIYPDPESITPPEQLTLTAGGNQVKISWQPKENPYTTGCVIERSRRHDGLYTVLTDQGLKRKIDNYTDKTVQGGFTYYYRIRSVGQRGTVGNASEAKGVMVKTAGRPKAPEHIDVQASPTNIHLQWRGLPLPVAGYIVEKKKDKDNTWVRLNSSLITRPEFNDPLNLGDYGKRRYRVTAVAFGNQKSKSSKEITVTLPGYPPVPAPLISNIKAVDGVVKLTIHPSEPVKRTDHFLLLRGNSATDVGLIIDQKIGHSKTNYSDKMVKPGEDYWYALVAVDRAGHRSQPSNKLFIIAGSPEIPQPKPPKVQFLTKPFRRVTISFVKPPGFLLAAVMRKAGDQSWLTINRGITGVTEIIDTDPPAAGMVIYRIVYLDESNHWGPPSKSISFDLDALK